MADSVVKFPTKPLENTLQRSLDRFYAAFRAKGYTDEQIAAEIAEIAKNMGGVEVDGTIYIGMQPDNQ